MSTEINTNGSAKAQQSSNICVGPSSSDPTNSNPLSKSKKRRLRKKKKKPLKSPDAPDKALTEPNSASTPVVNPSSNGIKQNLSKSENIEKSVPEKKNSPKKVIDISRGGDKSKSIRPAGANPNTIQSDKSRSENSKKQINTVSESIRLDGGKQEKKSKGNCGPDRPSSLTEVRNVPINSDPSIDKNLSLEGSSAIAERLAIVEKLFDSPAFSHIVDRIQVETDTRQDQSRVSDSPVNQKPPVSAEPKVSQLNQKPANMNTKSREEVMAEREAKKAAKAAAKAAKSKPKSADVPVDSANKPAQCAEKDTKIPTSQNEVAATEDATKVIQETSTVPSRVSDVVDGTAMHMKRNLAQLINHQVPETKKDVPLKIEEVKKSEPPTEKSKAELKAERRAKQEAQRAAKAASKAADPDQAKKTEEKIEKQVKAAVETVKEKVVRLHESNVPNSEGQYMIKLFSHLRLNKERLKEDYENLHPAIIKLGIQYESRIVCGSNARCVALLYALKKMLSDYCTPSKQEFARGVESVVARSLAYLDQCRPASVSMVNAVRHIKRHLTQIPNTLSDLQAKQKLYDVIDTYVREQIDVAGEAISNTVQKKITDGDVILTYGCSSLVRRILTESHKSGTKFSVIVADGAPWFEGREMLKRLVKEGLTCSYVPISAASFVMREASKVVVGAHALLANGCVVSRAGTSQLALLARSYNVAVLVCCETHKFSERVQTDAFVYNELGGVEREQKEKRLSLAYDLTPPDLVTAVVTEVGILPCTSVPVILRIKPSESVV
ncbi:translation initiation factor eIF-2B subunit delta [Nilaparvata lugens]|uniref:translation initiation factor eIF-2B subunit delta n=1 Tax=Nilaparvata lugens TaxID=108931 RepID=UPI00193D23DE|nr:translation initiation factor eIF-2B subunit delta [Nilaparvata lugens]XP_039301492.1 translation initiation factor eIF-2B subunit delta [Nilaparvata lugens]XP_039301497.1 translation initiation factor eIF-2B subunit delta [Nilaparvata lugens]